MRIFYDLPSGDVVGYVEGFDAPELTINPGLKYDPANIRTLNLHRFHPKRALAEDFDRPEVRLTPYDFKIVDDGEAVYLQHKSDKRLIITM